MDTKIRYNFDKLARRERRVDLTLTVNKNVFKMFDRRNYIIRSAESYAQIKSFKITCNRNQDVYLVFVRDGERLSGLIRGVDDWDW